MSVRLSEVELAALYRQALTYAAVDSGPVCHVIDDLCAARVALRGLLGYVVQLESLTYSPDELFIDHLAVDRAKAALPADAGATAAKEARGD